ncbi:hypothetical protein Droror1_Dr00025150, partial [Drosera rotundifolia]
MVAFPVLKCGEKDGENRLRCYGRKDKGEIHVASYDWSKLDNAGFLFGPKEIGWKFKWARKSRNWAS